MADPRRIVTIDYTNHRGERSIRRILPIEISFENNEWHHTTQWILYAVDMDRGEERTFALANVHEWTAA